MTKSIQQIQQELDKVQSAVAETAVEFKNQYSSYLDLLGNSVKQQLILASYQICTQFYPRSFLDLSLSQKQDLQQTLRQVGIDLQPELLAIIEQQELDPEPNELNLMAEIIKKLPKTKVKNARQNRAESAEPENNLESAEIDLETLKSELGNIELIAIESLEEDEDLDVDRAENEDSTDSEEILPLAPPKEKIELDNPQHLLLWQKQIERKIKKNLDRTSKKVNNCLQDADIIPDRIPAKIIDVAMQTDGSKGGRNNRKLPKAPNILHLSIDTNPSKKGQISQNLTQISLLRLRLSEIEFSDSLLITQRSQIRDLMSKINRLKNKYDYAKQELAVAQAQAAWRSSWYED
ncbi:MAG: hypothetical protein AAGE96_18650 [Cyanobacteria bacterium P01_G01_bin.19]